MSKKADIRKEVYDMVADCLAWTVRAEGTENLEHLSAFADRFSHLASLEDPKFDRGKFLAKCAGIEITEDGFSFNAK